MAEKHEVYHLKSGESKGVYASRKRALTQVDKLDNAYGGYAHGIRSHYEGESNHFAPKAKPESA